MKKYKCKYCGEGGEAVWGGSCFRTVCCEKYIKDLQQAATGATKFMCHRSDCSKYRRKDKACDCGYDSVLAELKAAGTEPEKP